MIIGKCVYPLVACRKEANERAEMVTQLLYGEHYEVLVDEGDWLQIKILRDGYEAWIDSKLHTKSDSISENISVLAAPYNKIKGDDDELLLLPGGSLLNKESNNSEIGNSIAESALTYLNAPYLWGGKSIWGIDCSGFVQVVFQIHGFTILRDAYQQAEQGETIEFNELIEAGDLAFFSKPEEKISHVGICLGNEKIIHASGQVRIDKLDHHGIYNMTTQKYTHELRLIKRIEKAVKKSSIG